jgi:hypothetical protein
MLCLEGMLHEIPGFPAHPSVPKKDQVCCANTSFISRDQTPLLSVFLVLLESGFNYFLIICWQPTFFL